MSRIIREIPPSSVIEVLNVEQVLERTVKLIHERPLLE